jgi:hypothetical protein
LSIYAAKKRAEIAPGVGTETDFFVIGPQLGFSDLLNEKIIAKLAEEHAKIKKHEEDTLRTARGVMQEYVEQLQRQDSQPQPQVPPKLEGPAEALDGTERGIILEQVGEKPEKSTIS